MLESLASYAHAFEPLNTDDAGTIGKSFKQIEQYFYVLHNSVAGNPSGASTPGEVYRALGKAKTFPLTFTHGLSESTELSIATTYYATPRGSYSPITNNILGLKWRFWGDGERGLTMAIKPSITLPTSTSQQVQGLGLTKTN